MDVLQGVAELVHLRPAPVTVPVVLVVVEPPTVPLPGHKVQDLVTTGNNLLMGAFIRQEVLDLLDGHLADVEVLLVPKHGLEPPPALLIPKINRIV